jgi:hypothetical protein
MGGKSQTTQTTQTQGSTQSYTPTGLESLKDLWSRVQGVASQPYTPYGGPLVSGLTPTQQAGINHINNAYGSALPYFDKAAGYAATGAAPITADQISKYISPYTQNVVDTTQAAFKNANDMQQQQVVGNAALQGALGGDRVKVAQSVLAGQQQQAQAPVIAGLYGSAYGQALGAAQADRSAAAQGAYTFGALAPSVQNSWLQGAQAQIGAGTLEQNTNQAGLNSAYQQYLQQLAFPYQQAQFLASTGLPAVTAQGGTGSGYSTGYGTSATQPPSPWGQIAGAGLTAAGLFLKDGGAVPGVADGGPTDFLGTRTYVPRAIGPISASSPQMFNMTPMSLWGGTSKPATTSPSPFTLTPQQTSGISALGTKLFGPSTVGDGTIDTGRSRFGSYGVTPTYEPSMADSWMQAGSGAGPWAAMASGGAVDDFGDTVRRFRNLLKGDQPITVDRSPFARRYDDGGTVGPFDRAWQDTVVDPVRDANRGIYDMPEAPAMSYAPLPPARPAAAAPSPAPVTPPSPFIAPEQAAPSAPAGMPPVMQGGGGSSPYAPPTEDSSEGALGGPGVGERATADGPTPFRSPITGGSSIFGNISPDARQAIIAAGLGMMASRSRSPLTQIGEGGLTGVKTYAEGQERTRKAQQEAERLAQQADQFAQNHDLSERRFKEEVTRSQRDFEERKREREVPVGLRRTDDGNLEFIPGGPHDPRVINAESTAKRTPGMSDEALETMVDNYRAGNTGVLTGVGRGTQGADNLNRFWNILAAKLKAEGMTGKDLAAAKANFTAQSAAASTAAKREATVAAAVEEAKGTFPIALQRSAEVPRTQFVPWNRAVQMVQAGTSSPELARFVTANQAVITAYSQAMSRTGTNSVHAQQHAEKLLSTATSPEAYEAVIHQMEQEMEMAQHAPEAVRARILRHISGRDEEAPAATKPAGGAQSPTLPARPSSVPAGSQYSPSRKMWRTPDGKLFNERGEPQ